MSSRNKSDVKKLFEFWCEVKSSHDAKRAGVITEQFPVHFRDEKTISDIPAFAFPCESESDSVQLYSFVLTTDDSKWRYGFCRQDPKNESAMVIITYLPWHDTFLKLMTVLAELRRFNNAGLSTFLTELYNSGIPDPGRSLRLFYNAGQSNFMFERPLQFQLPSIPENHNLNLYYNFVDPKNMIAVFAAMLAERRIIFTSRRLDKLSSCIQAANAFLYPMVWQHIFIPVLPMKLKDYLSAPMPYLIGVPQIVLETMSFEELGEVVILNCDTKICENPFDDVREMPPEIVSQMKKQLSHSQEHIGDRVSKIFLGVLVQLIGGYRDAVEFREAEKSFNRDKFIESRPSHLRPFLTKMMDLQIFQQFIDERLEMLNAGLGLSDEFELEIARYMEKKRRHGFLKNVKDKTNPAVKSAVKSVKEGSRGVKTAYKDLKSKLRDITPPNGSHFRSHLTANANVDRVDSNNFGKTGSHRSAPNSPLHSRKVVNTTGFQYASPEAINSATQCIPRRPPLAASNSNAPLYANGHADLTRSPKRNECHLVASPAISPSNSLCSSEMNLSQELQNHPLFKLHVVPTVDRSSLQFLPRRSLQPATNQLDQISIASYTPATASKEDNTSDLIVLDDSLNTSFDLEDFDPLNQNARPLPIDNNKSKKSTTLPAGTSLLMNSSSYNGLANCNYNSKLDHRLHSLVATTAPPLPKSKPPSMLCPNEDVELLRKYGLDQFSLQTPSTSKNNRTTFGTTGINNWTTFD